MKKGFTLIELLAVIVILAIIALIAVPIVVTIINDSTESSSLRSAEFYINAVENAIMNKNLEDGGNFNPKKCIVVKEENIGTKLPELGNESEFQTVTKEHIGDIICDDTTLLEIEAEGERPIDGEIIYDNGAVADVNLDYVEGVNIVESIDGGLVLESRNQICKAVTSETKTTGNVPKGKYEKKDEYICEVKPGVKYHFFILSTTDERVNLILDRNINSDGTLATESISEANAVNGVYNRTAWISQTDYANANTDGTSCSYTACHDEGPITALNFLDKATESWKYVLDLEATAYRDEFSKYSTIDLPKKARMPKYSELSSLGCNGSKVNTCPLWISNYLRNYTSVTGEGLQNISGMNGYWVMSSSNNTSKCTNCAASYIFYNGSLGNGTEAYQATWYGVRPVISLYKTNLY